MKCYKISSVKTRIYAFLWFYYEFIRVITSIYGTNYEAIVFATIDMKMEYSL